MPSRAHAAHCELEISVHRYPIRILNAFESRDDDLFHFFFFSSFDFGHMVCTCACISRFVMDLGEALRCSMDADAVNIYILAELLCQ